MNSHYLTFGLNKATMALVVIRSNMNTIHSWFIDMLIKIGYVLWLWLTICSYLCTRNLDRFFYEFSMKESFTTLYGLLVFSLKWKSSTHERHECISMKFLLLKRTNRIEVCILGENFSWRKRGGGGLFRIRSLCLIIST